MFPPSKLQLHLQTSLPAPSIHPKAFTVCPTETSILPRLGHRTHINPNPRPPLCSPPTTLTFLLCEHKGNFGRPYSSRRRFGARLRHCKSPLFSSRISFRRWNQHLELALYPPRRQHCILENISSLFLIYLFTTRLHLDSAAFTAAHNQIHSS